MKDFFSTVEAAKMLGLSRVTMFNRIRSGEIKALKVGRNYIIPNAEMARLMAGGLSLREKQEIEDSVDRVAKEYKETLQLLKDA